MSRTATITDTEELGLRGLNGDHEGVLLRVAHRELLGRADECSIQLHDPRISRQHAEISASDGALWVQDLGSQNGTWVNNSRVSRVRLRLGDLLRVGQFRFQVVVATETQSRSVHMVEEPTASHQLVRRVGTDRLSRPSELPLDSWLRQISDSEEEPDFNPSPQLWAGLRRYARNAEVLFQASRNVQHIEEDPGALARVVESVVDFLEVDRGVVALVEDKPDNLRPEVVVYGDRATPDTAIAMSRTVAQHVLKDRCGVISQDAHADRRFDASESIIATPARALLAAPLVAGARVLGIFELSTTAPGARFTEQDLELLTVIASMIGSALHRREVAQEQEATIRLLQEARQSLLGTQAELERTERLARIGELAQKLVHEVGNHVLPLQMAELIKERYPADAEVAMVIDGIMAAGESLETLAGEVRAYLHGQKFERIRSTMKLSTVAHSADRFVRRHEDVCNHTLELLVEVDPEVEIDLIHLRQAVINLVKNAGQAINHDEGRIIIRVWQDGAMGCLSVSDNGPGIAPGVAAQIFDPNFSTKGARGSGIGLGVARERAEEHGGSLSFSTTPGLGTTFTLRVPVASPNPAEVRPHRPLHRTINPDESGPDEATLLFDRGRSLLDEMDPPTDAS